jgi:signal transduction histidine kinase
VTRHGQTLYESEPEAAATVSGATSGWHVAITTVSDDMELRVGRSDVHERDMLARVRNATLAALGAALLLGIVGGGALTRRALRPIKHLARATETIVHSGRFDARVPTRGTGDELDELATLFNKMLARNEALVVGMREALDNVAHDLRTPLTRVRAGAELALKGPDDPAMLKEAAADCVDETDTVLAMLRTLMDISAAETGVMRLQRGRVALDDLAREVVDTYEMVADERGVRIVSSLESVAVDGDATRLRQMLANLVDNAVKYTPTGGIVEVRSHVAGDRAVIVVRDSGMGIAEEDRARIFERLYRGDRSRSEPGLGLGLSFVKAICDAHGGDIRVESTLGKGTEMTVTLPGAPPL